MNSNMKVVFISNYYNPHQAPFSERMNQMLGEGNYWFIETDQMSDERRKMGYEISCPSFVLPPAQTEEEKKNTQSLIDEADAVILGHGADRFLKRRHLEGKLTLRYSERFYKHPFPSWQLPLRCVKNYFRMGRNRNEYMLCASAYTAADLAKTHTMEGKAYKWGYFPRAYAYDPEKLMEKRRKEPVVQILWVGRLISWKHPEAAVRMASQLKKKTADFRLTIIGEGEMRGFLEEMIRENQLEDHVQILDYMKNDEVRRKMLEADIYLTTSDFEEGWGAVVNEAMNSACAVVGSHAVGSVPYLIRDGENGVIYPNGDEVYLCRSVYELIEDRNLREKLGKGAYRTITEEWNADIAAERLIRLIRELDAHQSCSLYRSGPCSKAEILENDWFRG